MFYNYEINYETQVTNGQEFICQSHIYGERSLMNLLNVHINHPVLGGFFV